MRSHFQQETANHSTLQRLFTLQECSLARYAAQAGLHARDDAKECLALITRIAANQECLGTRIGRLLTARSGRAAREVFPVSFTRINSLAAPYVAREILAKQPGLIASIEKAVASLHGDVEGQRLARQTLAYEEEHLRQLKQLVGGRIEVATHPALAA